MATRKENGKVTETVKRLLKLEDRAGALYERVVGVENATQALRVEVHGLRDDLNQGVGRLLTGLERLEAAIDRVAQIRPRLDALEVRVDRLERPA